MASYRGKHRSAETGHVPAKDQQLGGGGRGTSGSKATLTDHSESFAVGAELKPDNYDR